MYHSGSAAALIPASYFKWVKQSVLIIVVVMEGVRQTVAPVAGKQRQRR